MSFGKIQSNFISLKKRLTVAVGSAALDDINIEPPKGDDDELSFLRLVAWTYVLIFESGKISLNFLRKLPPWKESELLPYVRPLRTWMSHNLLFESDHDVQTMGKAMDWFTSTCGTGIPQTSSHWKACFAQLLSDVNVLLSNAIVACDAFNSEIDGARLKSDLKEKLDRNWAAYRFDRYVEDAINRFGYSGFDVVLFRNRYLEQWRRVVITALPEQIERNLILRIEADILNEMRDALPITAEEFKTLIAFRDEEAVAAALIMLRSQVPESRPALLKLICTAVGAEYPLPEAS